MTEGTYLPPTVIELLVDDEAGLAELAEFRAALADTAASADASSAGIGRSMDDADSHVKGFAEDSEGSLAGYEGAMQHARDETDDAADDIHDNADRMGSDLKDVGESAAVGAAGVHESADRMGSDFKSVGESAVLGGAATRQAMEDARDGVTDAEQDIEDRSGNFSKRVGKVFTSVGNTLGNWGVPFSKSVSDVGEKIGEAESKGHGFQESLYQVGKTASVIGGVLVAGFAVESVKAADGFDTANTMLQNAIRNTGASLAAVDPQIEATDRKLSGLGFTGKESEEALTKLTTATRSPTAAINDMGLAANLARYKNIGLSEAGEMLAKVYAGSNRVLTQLGISAGQGSAKLASLETATKGVTTAQLSLKSVENEVSEGKLKGAAATIKLEQAHLALSTAEEKVKKDQEAVPAILAKVEDKLHGTAEAYGHTLPGEMKILGAETDEIEVAFGNGLIPILKTLVSVGVDVIGWFIHGGTAAHILAGVIAGPLALAVGYFATQKLISLVSYIGEAGGALIDLGTKAVAAAASFVTGTEAMEVGEDALAETSEATGLAVDSAFGPIGLAIGAVVLAITLLATHWKQVWSAVESVVDAAVSFVKQHILLLVSIISFPIAAMAYLATHWKEVWADIKAVVSTAVNDIKSVMSSAWDMIKSAATAAWNAVKGIFSSAWDGLKNIVSTGIHDVVGFFTSLPSKVMSILSTLVHDFENLGSEMIHGLISGITSAPGAVVKAVEGLIPGGSAIGKVTSALGLATGGIVTQPTLAVVGEAGPEAVIPLGNVPGLGRNGVSPLPASTPPPTNSGSGGLQIGTINMLTQANPNQITRQLYEIVRPLMQGAGT